MLNVSYSRFVKSIYQSENFHKTKLFLPQKSAKAPIKKKIFKLYRSGQTATVEAFQVLLVSSGMH